MASLRVRPDSVELSHQGEPSIQEQSTSADDTTDSHDAHPSATHGGPSRIKEFKRWWSDCVSVVIPDWADPRDYLALERTYLAYIRTSIALALTGTLVAQFAVLSDRMYTAQGVSMKQVGTPIAATLDVMALIVAAVGGARYMRQQSLLIQKRWVTGGFDILTIFALAIIANIVLFGTFLAI